ncbi:MAG: hypothetical protein AB2L14_32715 [Candidatus Xenobiia bacterium LiM19]
MRSDKEIGGDGYDYRVQASRSFTGIQYAAPHASRCGSSITDNKADDKENLQIEQTDDWLIIGGLKVPKKANYISAFAPSFSQAR